VFSLVADVVGDDVDAGLPRTELPHAMHETLIPTTAAITVT
jgi:hypothetical protein